LDSVVRENAKAVIQGGFGASFVRVFPDSVSVGVGDSITFSLMASGCPFDDPAWSVLDLSSGSLGDIRANGTYVAPALVSDDLTMMIMVESPDCPGKRGIAMAAITKPDAFVIELEDFTTSFGSGISKTIPCSGGFAVSGLDQPGEWIEVPFEVHAGAEYLAEIHYAAGVGDILIATVAAQGCGSWGSTPEAEFQMGQGNGLG
jgi:hypothetical protein